MRPRRTAVAYQRVSTGKQAEEGHSLETQADLIDRYCKSNGLNLTDRYQDKAKSARTVRKRVGLERAIKKACDTQGVLVVYSMSRLARSVVDANKILAQLKEKGADLAFVDSSISTVGPHGKMVFSMMAVFAEFESDMIGERVKATQRRIKRQLGYCTSGVQPLGWELVDGKRVRVPAEVDLIKQVKRVKKGRTFRAAAAELNRLEVPTVAQARGRKTRIDGWVAGTVNQVVKLR